MFIGNVFPAEINLAIVVKVMATVIVSFVFLRMAVGYTKKRAAQRYAINKEKAPSIKGFRSLSKVLFVLAMLITLLSYWIEFPTFLLFHDSILIRFFGAIIVLLGYFGLNHSFARLDQNYSPLFDAYKPFSLTTSGIYAFIRHPIYLFNLFVSFGLTISSGVYVVVITALIGFGFVLRALFIEENYLKQQFEEYDAYCSRTWRFIPYVF